MPAPSKPQTRYPFRDPAAQRVFDGFSAPERAALLAVRDQIFDVAAETSGVGEITETLKWNQPAYLTSQSRAGTTIRLGAGRKDCVSVFTHCQTSVMSEMRQKHPEAFAYEKNRAVHMPVDAPLPEEALYSLIHLALTYHIRR